MIEIQQFSIDKMARARATARALLDMFERYSLTVWAIPNSPDTIPDTAMTSDETIAQFAQTLTNDAELAATIAAWRPTLDETE